MQNSNTPGFHMNQFYVLSNVSVAAPIYFTGELEQVVWSKTPGMSSRYVHVTLFTPPIIWQSATHVMSQCLYNIFTHKYEVLSCISSMYHTDFNIFSGQWIKRACYTIVLQGSKYASGQRNDIHSFSFMKPCDSGLYVSQFNCNFSVYLCLVFTSGFQEMLSWLISHSDTRLSAWVSTSCSCNIDWGKEEEKKK